MTGRDGPLTQNLDDLRELRVMLPVSVYRQLFSLKILRNVTIGETVTRALTQYFDEHPEAASMLAQARAREKAETSP